MLSREQVIEIAIEEAGVKEIAGPQDNPRIVEYKQATPLVKDTHDEVAWCASFVNWVLAQGGINGTGSPRARSFLSWGVPLEKPLRGCIAVLSRGAPPAGHVGFFVERVGGMVRILGGNQRNEVRVSTYAESDVIGYRWIDKA